MLLAARAARKQLLLFKPKLPLSLKPLLSPSSSLPHFTLYSFQYPNPNNPFPTPQNFSSKAKKITNFRRDGNFDETTSCNLPICPGCGVNMQESNPKLPGYSIKPSPKNPDYKPPIDRRAVAEEPEISFSLKTGVLQELVEPETPPKTDHKPVGILRVEGVLPSHAKLFDTPELLNPHQITTRLTREEQKLVNVTKELKPRTYRLKGLKKWVF